MVTELIHISTDNTIVFLFFSLTASTTFALIVFLLMAILVGMSRKKFPHRIMFIFVSLFVLFVCVFLRIHYFLILDIV